MPSNSNYLTKMHESKFTLSRNIMLRGLQVTENTIGELDIIANIALAIFAKRTHARY